MGRKLWTEEEEQVIRDEFPYGGSKAVQEKLPHRAITAIQKHAQKIGVKQGVKFFHINDGYIVLEAKRGQKFHLHRLIMEAKLGRRLRPDEIVHHIDGNKMNNHPDNLAITNRSEHAKIHRDDEIHRFVAEPQGQPEDIV